MIHSRCLYVCMVFACAGQITHEVQQYVHLYCEQIHILIFKSRDTPLTMKDLPELPKKDEEEAEE